MSTTLERPTECTSIAPQLPEVITPPQPPTPPPYQPTPVAIAIAAYLGAHPPQNDSEALVQARVYRFRQACDCTGSRSRILGA